MSERPLYPSWVEHQLCGATGPDASLVGEEAIALGSRIWSAGSQGDDLLTGAARQR